MDLDTDHELLKLMVSMFVGWVGIFVVQRTLADSSINMKKSKINKSLAVLSEHDTEYQVFNYFNSKH